MINVKKANGPFTEYLWRCDIVKLAAMARGTALTLAMAHLRHLYDAAIACRTARHSLHYKNMSDTISHCFNVRILAGNIVYPEEKLYQMLWGAERKVEREPYDGYKADFQK